MSELAWHFAPNTGRTRHSDEPIVVGEWLEVEGPLRISAHGLHASKRLLDALCYAPGELCCRVEVEGDIVHGEDKLVARRRRVVQMVDATNVLHEFACRCAEDALALVDDPDPRSIDAIVAKRAWVRGDITDDELAAARAAAGAAAGAAWAARYAAWVAAWDDARAAAWDAAWYAAAAAAWDAARAAEWAAARVGAWSDVAVDRQNRRLTAMISHAMNNANE